MDLDNINNKITKKSVDSCFKKNNWSGCFPSQKVGYYDIFALRAENWNEFDCFSEVYKSRINSYSFIFENNKKDEFLDFIDKFHDQIDRSQELNYEIYQNLGEGMWNNNSAIFQTYDEDVEYLRSWLDERLTWMMGNL